MHSPFQVELRPSFEPRSHRIAWSIWIARAGVLLLAAMGLESRVWGEDESPQREVDQPIEVGEEAVAEESDVPGDAEAEPISRERLKQAITAAIEPMESSAREYRDQRQCFSCHHQAVPVLALDLAKRLQFDVDVENLRLQVEHTKAHLERGREEYLAGKGQGGRADTAGWALWTLEVAGESVDETTIPVANYLLDWQRDQGHWSPPSQRPPTESSPFTSTYVGLRGISYFLPEEREAERNSRMEAVKAWLQMAPPADTEDHVYRLRSLSYLDDLTSDTEVSELVVDAREQLVALQRPDGGWGQTEEMASDAYATATALAALAESGGLPTGSDPYQAGARFLLENQLPDGTWHVVTRSKPVQVFFESGFPHGKDQFLSMAATAWSTYALLLPLDQAERPAKEYSTEP